MSRSIKSSELKGRNIRRIDNKTLYYDFFTKKYLQITNMDAKKYLFFETRVPLACLLGLIAAYFTNNYIYGIITGIAIWIVMFVLFRVLFISSLNEYHVKNVENGKSLIENIIKNKSKSKLLLTTLIMAGLGVFIFVNAYTQQYELLIMVLNYIFSALFIIISILNLIAFVKK